MNETAWFTRSFFFSRVSVFRLTESDDVLVSKAPTFFFFFFFSNGYRLFSVYYRRRKQYCRPGCTQSVYWFKFLVDFHFTVLVFMWINVSQPANNRLLDVFIRGRPEASYGIKCKVIEFENCSSWIVSFSHCTLNFVYECSADIRRGLCQGFLVRCLGLYRPVPPVMRKLWKNVLEFW